MAGLMEAQAAGLRERKKQRTRWALIDAALDLFLAQGYETTTIDEIVAVATSLDKAQREKLVAKLDRFPGLGGGGRHHGGGHSGRQG